MNCKISHYLFLCLFIFSAKTLIAQEVNSDTTRVDYAKELRLLKQQVNALQMQVETTNQKTNKKLNLLDRTKIGNLTIFRAAELDWDQHSYNPTTQQSQRDGDRFWARIFSIVYLDTKISDKFDYRFSILLYPGFTFGNNTDSKLTILIDELWLKYNINKNQSVKFGRQNASEIWPNQIGTQFDFWRHDGVSYAYSQTVNQYTFSGKAAFFIEDYRNNLPLAKQGRMYGFSVNAKKNNENRSFEISTGLIKANALENRFESSLQDAYWDGDLAQDYSIWASEIVYTFKTLNNLSLKVDFYRNFQNYSQGLTSSLITDAQGRTSYDPGFDKNTTPNFTNQRTGFYGGIKSDLPFISKKLSATAGYLYMEKYAALDVFAQFDLARWTSTNLKGLELTFEYKLSDIISFKSRTFLMEEIKGLHGANPEFRRNGNRTRLDIIITF